MFWRCKILIWPKSNQIQSHLPKSNYFAPKNFAGDAAASLAPMALSAGQYGTIKITIKFTLLSRSAPSVQF